MAFSMSAPKLDCYPVRSGTVGLFTTLPSILEKRFLYPRKQYYSMGHLLSLALISYYGMQIQC